MNPYNDENTKTQQVERMFDAIAWRYDFLNHLLSLGIDRRWRKRVVKILQQDNPSHILDVATGTADLALTIAQSIERIEIVGIDLSAEMVRIGQTKIAKAGLDNKITLLTGNVESLPLPAQRFDAVTVAFGVRNFENIEAGLSEMSRVLKTGGKLVVLEFSTPGKGFFAYLYRLYFHRLLPLIGGIVSGDRDAYRYLPGSVDEFPSPDRFVSMMQDAGCDNCQKILLVNGIACIYVGEKQ